MTSLVHRNLSGEMITANVRYATYSGVEHVVIPVVALVGDIVVQGMDSQGPEFVPLSVISQVPQGWNNRPLVYNHPTNGTGSANDPLTLESICFGSTFGAKIEDDRLKMDMWANPTKAKSIGAGEVIDRCKKGEPVEVSVGVFVYLKKENGIAPNGQQYEYVWVSIVPDHLAALKNGDRGACSVEMGCGAPRILQERGGVNVEKVTAPDTKNNGDSVAPDKGMISRIFSAIFGTRNNEGEGTSYSEVYQALYRVLGATEPGFAMIEDVFPETSFVVYSVYTDTKKLYFRRSFMFNEDGAATLGDDKVAVVSETVWKVVSESEGTATVRPEQLSTSSEHGKSDEHVCTCQKGEKNLSDKKEGTSTGANANTNPIVDKMISKGLATEADRAHLSSLSETALKALEASIPAEDTPTNSNTQTENLSASTPKTEAEWFRDAPEKVREIVARAEKEEQLRRQSYISSLLKVQTRLKEPDLKKKTTDQLEELVEVLGVNNPNPVNPATGTYAARGLFSADTPLVDDEPKYEPLDAWGLSRNKTNKKNDTTNNSKEN
jgi:hypothetical protein